MNCKETELQSKCKKQHNACETAKPYQRQRLLFGNCELGPIVPVFSGYESGDHELANHGHIQEHEVTSSIHHPDDCVRSSITDHLIHCPLCNDVIIEAMVSRCGHTFCHECIHKSLVKKLGCPLCSKRFEGIHVDCIDDIVQKNLCELDPEFRRRWIIAKKSRKARWCKKQKHVSRHFDGAMLYIDKHLLKLQFLGFTGVCGKVFGIFKPVVNKGNKHKMALGICGVVFTLLMLLVWTNVFYPFSYWEYLKGLYHHMQQYEFKEAEDDDNIIRVQSDKLPGTTGFDGKDLKKNCTTNPKFSVWKKFLDMFGYGENL